MAQVAQTELTGVVPDVQFVLQELFCRLKPEMQDVQFLSETQVEHAGLQDVH